MARVFRSARGTVRSYSLGLAVFGAALGKKYPATIAALKELPRCGSYRATIHMGLDTWGCAEDGLPQADAEHAPRAPRKCDKFHRQHHNHQEVIP